MKLYCFNEDGYFEKIENGGKPAGIAITMPAKFFEEGVYTTETFDRMMAIGNERGDFIWGQTISAIPQLEVEYVYLVFGGRVQYRLSILNYEKNATKQFDDGGIIRVFENKNWVNLCAPIVKAPFDFYMRGFQGFRYVDYLF